MSNSSKILIVEDDGIIAEDISESLRRLGYERTAVAHAADSAIRVVLEMKPDIVLMDIKLKGGLDGIQAAEQSGSGFACPSCTSRPMPIRKRCNAPS